MAIAIFLAIAGSFGLIVGLHDVSLHDEPLSITVVGALLLAGGVLVLLAAVLLYLAAAHRKMAIENWSGQLVLSACLVVAGVGSFFGIAEVASFDTSPLVLGVAILVTGIAIASLIILLLSPEITLGKLGPTLIALVGTAFSIFQFWFAQQYLPTRQPPALESTATLEPTGIALNGLDGYRATLTLKNVGSTKVIALAGAYTVSGAVIPPREVAPYPRAVLEPFLKQIPDPYAPRFSHHSGLGKAPTIIQAGRLFAENRYFEPGEELSREFVALVPRCRYTLLRLRANVVVAKGTLLRIRDEGARGRGYFEDPGRIGVWAQWHIDDNSWVHDILEGKEQSILVNYVSTSGRFDVSFFRVTGWLISGTKKRTPEEVAKFTQGARERIGLADTFSDYELAINPPARQGEPSGAGCPTAPGGAQTS